MTIHHFCSNFPECIVTLIIDSQVNCNQGMCAPVDMSDVTNACVALCGMDPCNEDDFKRSLGFENVSLNSMSVENFLDSIDV